MNLFSFVALKLAAKTFLFLHAKYYFPSSFTDFSKESRVLLLSEGQRWGWGVNFVDVLDCWEFKNTNFKFSYTYMCKIFCPPLL